MLVKSCNVETSVALVLRRSRLIAVPAVPAALGVLLLGTATTGRRGAGEPQRRAAPRLLAAPRAPDSPRVAYLGPRRLRGLVTLQARVRSEDRRVVAVTFLLDGQPLGTDAIPPYRLDVDATTLPRGQHVLRVQAVDVLDRRTLSAPMSVIVAGERASGVTVDPQRLAHVLGALSRGHVTVRLRPGRYPAGSIIVGSGARLVGSGPETVLVPRRGTEVSELVIVRGQGVRISDLSIDGAGRAAVGVSIADGSHDIRMQRLRIYSVREDGLEAWGEHSDVSVQDSAIDGGGVANAGFFDLGSERSGDISVVRTRISRFRGFGVDFAYRFYGRSTAALHSLALDNFVTDIKDPGGVHDGTHEGGIWSGGVEAAIIGNTIRRTGVDGVETVGSSTRSVVVGNDIADTPVGIYLEHETNASLIARNSIARVRTGINVEWRYGGAGSADNTFVGNRVANAQQAGLFLDVGADRNRILDNQFSDVVGPAIVMQGSSQNIVVRNDACRGGPVVREQTALYDDGSLARSLANRIAFNRRLKRCLAS